MNGLATPCAPHELLAEETSVSELAASCIAAAGSSHSADPAHVIAAILNMAATQVRHWFGALNRPSEAAAFEALLGGHDFQEHMLWDSLTGDSGKTQVHNQLAQLLSSDLVRQILVGSIRQGNHTTASVPDTGARSSSGGVNLAATIQ